MFQPQTQETVTHLGVKTTKQSSWFTTIHRPKITTVSLTAAPVTDGPFGETFTISNGFIGLSSSMTVTEPLPHQWGCPSRHGFSSLQGYLQIGCTQPRSLAIPFPLKG
jgi:hypothetical protein